jgi:hypothetical protein
MEWYIMICVFLSILLFLLTFRSYFETRFVRIERKLNLLLRHSGLDPLQDLPLSDRVKQIASDPARKIEAIQAYRKETGARLAEAVQAVETFINSK